MISPPRGIVLLTLAASLLLALLKHRMSGVESSERCTCFTSLYLPIWLNTFNTSCSHDAGKLMWASDRSLQSGNWHLFFFRLLPSAGHQPPPPRIMLRHTNNVPLQACPASVHPWTSSEIFLFTSCLLAPYSTSFVRYISHSVYWASFKKWKRHRIQEDIIT